MKYIPLLYLTLLLCLAAMSVSAQKLDLVEGELSALDSSKAVSIEFYFDGMTINQLPDQAHFMRVNRSDTVLKKAFLSARDSLAARAFLRGYKSLGKQDIPHLEEDTRETRYHLIVKTVHWESSFQNDENNDWLRLEYILLMNPHRKIQEARYYMRKVEASDNSSENPVGGILDAYFLAGKALAKTLKAFQPAP